jgi:biotin carboxyl carrier protein
MEYRLKIGEQTASVNLDINADNQLRASIGDESFDVRYSLISENYIHLDVNGQGVNVYVSENSEGKTVHINGISYLVQDADKVERSPSRKAGAKDIPQEVTPPMPSVVVRVLVAEGDLVEKGQGVVVVSAMKMETTLMAPYSGRIVKINFAVGDKVMPGQVLVDIEKKEDDPENLSEDS